jgi:resuscitation-promoting factor RpfB
MARKWNDYTRREKTIGVLGAILGVFVIGGIASGVNTPAETNSDTSSGQVKVQSDISYKEITEKVSIPFKKTSTESDLYNKGTTQVTTSGVNGEKIITYKVTMQSGKETNRQILKEEITKEPVAEVSTIGTYVEPAPAQQVAPSCDPNYSGACVPIASDVDCAGGSGNGPAYVSGPVYVVGTDIYKLDSDKDGVGCE